VTAGLETVGLRVPDHPVALEMLRLADLPVAGPSANRSNRVSPTEARHVEEELGDRVDLILDGGKCGVGIESTVLDLSRGRPTILRPGGVRREEIEAVIGPVEAGHFVQKAEAAAASPGQQEVHYSPRTPAFRFESGDAVEASPRDVVLTREAGFVGVANERMPASPDAYARELYGRLRKLDAAGHARILVEMPPDTPQWLAIRDRLTRATRPL
jgi:L-threonylcarbamoyladenylate synthase